MDKIINYLLLIIIFVFDPLAIALVVAANYAFEQLKKNYKTNLYGEKVKVKDNPPRGLTEDVIEESKAKRVEAPTQTSSSFSEEQIQWEREEKILSDPGVSNWRKNKVRKEREKRSKDNDDLTKIY